MAYDLIQSVQVVCIIAGLPFSDKLAALEIIAISRNAQRPPTSMEQVRAALRYYAEYPDEIDQILAEGEAEAVKARLYRSLGLAGYGRVTDLPDRPRAIRETRAGYDEGDEGTDERD